MLERLDLAHRYPETKLCKEFLKQDLVHPGRAHLLLGFLQSQLTSSSLFMPGCNPRQSRLGHLAITTDSASFLTLPDYLERSQQVIQFPGVTVAVQGKKPLAIGS